MYSVGYAGYYGVSIGESDGRLIQHIWLLILLSISVRILHGFLRLANRPCRTICVLALVREPS